VDVLPEEVIAAHCESMAGRGFSILPGMLDAASCDRLRNAVARAIADYRPGATEQSRLDRYLIHDLLCQERMFAALLEDPRLQQVLEPLLGASWIMYAFTSSSLPPREGNYGSRIHVDSPRFVPGYAFNIGVIWTLDEFTAANGATRLLPGSHRSEAAPQPEEFERHCVEAICPRGSLIVFNGRTFHRAGENSTGEWRHALTMNACRSFMKQRFDWVRFIPAAISDGLNAQARRIIGFDTRLPASLAEFFVADEQRLYKPGQG
jgi:ectoine hydroxylase-related dioxygenase (phytanoyl-CoA dioxygenase family)